MIERPSGDWRNGEPLYDALATPPNGSSELLQGHASYGFAPATGFTEGDIHQGSNDVAYAAHWAGSAGIAPQWYRADDEPQTISEDAPRPKKPDPEKPATQPLPEQVTVSVPLSMRAYVWLAIELVNAVDANVLLSRARIENRRSLQRIDTVRTLVNIAETSQSKARALVIEAVLEGDMSRVQAAEILGVHQGTVARWVKEINAGAKKDT